MSAVEPYTDFIRFECEQLSNVPPAEVTALSQACDALAEQELLATYDCDEHVGSNGNVSLRHPEGGFVITGTQLVSKLWRMPCRRSVLNSD